MHLAKIAARTSRRAAERETIGRIMIAAVDPDSTTMPERNHEAADVYDHD